jgi:hypothetical protein
MTREARRSAPPRARGEAHKEHERDMLLPSGVGEAYRLARPPPSIKQNRNRQRLFGAGFTNSRPAWSC